MEDAEIWTKDGFLDHLTFDDLWPKGERLLVAARNLAAGARSLERHVYNAQLSDEDWTVEGFRHSLCRLALSQRLSGYIGDDDPRVRSIRRAGYAPEEWRQTPKGIFRR